MSTEFIYPDWPEIAGVKAVSTTRVGGCSEGPYCGFNLGDHVDDSDSAVLSNRNQLACQLAIDPRSIQWLRQVHGVSVHCLGKMTESAPVADAAYTTQRQKVCAVLTADCLPVLFASRDGCEVAVAHAGWRGLLQGVLESTLESFSSKRTVQAWLGPAIGPGAFEVGPEVFAAFTKRSSGFKACFKPGTKDRWHADLYRMARMALESAGVTAAYGGDYCTYSDSRRFYSYRRDGITGRMATLIWKL